MVSLLPPLNARTRKHHQCNAICPQPPARSLSRRSNNAIGPDGVVALAPSLARIAGLEGLWLE